MSMSIPAIILDGHQRSALAAVRSLGRLGCPVTVAEKDRRCLAASSRYARRTLAYPDPALHPSSFCEWLEELSDREAGAVLMPMTDLTVPLVLRTSAVSSTLRTALPSLDAYEAVSDKLRLFELASSKGVRAPRTVAVSRAEPHAAELAELSYPLVVKPRRSVKHGAARAVKKSVSYARTAKELAAQLEQMLLDHRDEVLVQEYVQGRGAGVFALYDRGTPLLFFCHRRIREKPPSGGVSVLCESVPLDEQAVQSTRRLLDPLAWHGVAMVEFKLDSAGLPWLIEVNARFWGSLQLAIDAGADFPGILYRIAAGEHPAPVTDYRAGRRLRWLLGDLDNLYVMLKDPARTLREKASAIARFCIPWSPGLRYELMRWSDPCPALFAVGEYLRSALRRR